MGKVYQISSISYCVWWAAAWGELGTRTAIGFFSERSLPRRRGRPTAPQVPSLLWQTWTWTKGPFPLPEQAEPGSASPCPGRGRRVCVCQGRKKGGSVILLENKLHPLSIFIKEDPERSSTRPGVCELNGDVSLFLFLIFVFVLYFLYKKKVLFYCLFYFFW